MKYILILFLFIISLNCIAQQDSITLPVKDVIKTAERLKEFTRTDSLQTLQINELKNQVSDLESIVTTNTSIMELKNRELDLYKDFVDVYTQIPARKDKWYESRVFNFVFGALSATLGIYLGGKLAKGI